MSIFTVNKSKSWEEKGRTLSRRLYYLEFVLFAISLATVTFSSFVVFEEASIFKRSLILLFGIGGISSFHFLFHRLWELWAELHDRMESSHTGQTASALDGKVAGVKSTIKIVFSSENEDVRKKHISYLQVKVGALTGAPCEVIEAKSAIETLSYVTDHVVHLVILDSHYQNEESSLWAEKIKQVDKNIPVVVCSTKTKQVSSAIDAWFSYLQRDSDVEKLLPYFLARETINGTRGALS